MESAPKDKKILISFQGECAIGCWEQDDYCLHPIPFWYVYGPWLKSFVRKTKPDGWQPLPEPLKEGGKI